MAPRSGKRKFRARQTIPVWLPLPRPCLRSMNMPSPPYYMPISPEIYLPPWTLPPPYFTKPLCHCANENFCTATNCRDSTECLKMHPIFCPHVTNREESTNLQQNESDQEYNSDNATTSSSNSDINICTACGAPSGKLRTSGKKNKSQDNQAKTDDTSRVTKNQDSTHNVKNNKQESAGDDAERNNVSNTNTNVSSRERFYRTESGNSSPEITPSNKHNDYVHSSCQTALSNTQSRGSNRSTQRKFNLNSPKKDKKHSGYSTDLEDSKSSDLETDTGAKNNTKNEFGCGSCSGSNSGLGNDLEIDNTNLIPANKRKLAKTDKLKTDIIHIDQLTDNLSSARKRQANKNSGCCFPGSENSCKTDVDMDTMEIPYKNKSRKNSACECYPTNTPGKSPSKSHKLSDCICSSSNKQHDPTKSRKKLKGECSPNKISQKVKHRKVSECSCPSRDVPYLDKVSSKSQKISENCTDGCNPKTNSPKVTTKKSKKSLNDTPRVSKTNVKQSSCRCKFPPAYEHLSCTGNETNNCSCTKNI